MESTLQDIYGGPLTYAFNVRFCLGFVAENEFRIRDSLCQVRLTRDERPAYDDLDCARVTLVRDGAEDIALWSQVNGRV